MGKYQEDVTSSVKQRKLLFIGKLKEGLDVFGFIVRKEANRTRKCWISIPVSKGSI